MTTSTTTDTKGTGQHAKVNGLDLYYETHGALLLNLGASVERS